MNLVFNAAFKAADPQLARIAAIIPGLFFYSAVPAGIIALCGIKKHGRKHLLISGLAGIIIPLLLGVMAIAAFSKVRESSHAMFLHQVAEEMNKSAPRMIDEITRLDGASIEHNNILVIKQTVLSLAADEIDRDLWMKNAVPVFRTAFRNGPLVNSVKSGSTVIYRYHGKDGILIDELIYKPADFK